MGTFVYFRFHIFCNTRSHFGLLGNKQALGEVFHITSDVLLTWNQIFEIVAQAAGTKAHIVHIPSDCIARFAPEWGASLLGDKSHSMIFDNNKIKQAVPDFSATIPFAHGAVEIIQWYDSNPSRQVIDNSLNLLMDEMITLYETAWAPT